MKGFVYNQEKHEYLLDDQNMTGVTTVLGSSGDKNGLIQWSANLGAAKAFQLAVTLPTDVMCNLVTKINDYKKIDARACKELDKLFPAFKEARTAHAKKRDKAADTGTEAHKICEEYERGTPPDKLFTTGTVEAVARAKAYIEWYNQNIDKTYFVEKPLFSRSLFIGGTPDGGFRTRDGKNFINDKKFKSSIWDVTPFLQMAAYTDMIKEMSQDTETSVRLEWKDGTVEEYANPQEYLKSIGDVKWDGSVVILVDERNQVKPTYRYAQEEDIETFRASARLYRAYQSFNPN